MNLAFVRTPDRACCWPARDRIGKPQPKGNFALV